MNISDQVGIMKCFAPLFSKSVITWIIFCVFGAVSQKYMQFYYLIVYCFD